MCVRRVEVQLVTRHGGRLGREIRSHSVCCYDLFLFLPDTEELLRRAILKRGVRAGTFAGSHRTLSVEGGAKRVKRRLSVYAPLSCQPPYPQGLQSCSIHT